MMDGSASGESDGESYSFVDEGSSSGGDNDDDDSFMAFDDDEDDFSTHTNGNNDAGADEDGEHEANWTGYRHMHAVLRQHLPAIVIAVVAAVLGHAHLNDGEYLHVTLSGLYRDFVEHHGGTRPPASSTISSGGSKGGKFAAAPTLNVPTHDPTPHLSKTSGAAGHHHHEYRRTANLGFCQDHDEVNSKRTNHKDYSEGVRKLLIGGGDYGSAMRYKYRSIFDDTNTGTVDSDLVPFDFRIPSDLASIMGMHYLADEKKEDTYSSVLAAGESISADREYQCLYDKATPNKKHNFISGWGLAYVRPHISTFYREGGTSDGAASPDLGTDAAAANGQFPDMTSVKSLLKARRDEHYQRNPEAAAEAAKREEQVAVAAGDSGRKIAAVTPTFTGFAAKFTNLSPEPVNLYWDGRGGSDARLVGRVPPFESLGTATTPGQSFSLIPVTQDGYDDRFVLQRWTMTADEAHVYYNPSGADGVAKLSVEQQARLQMWKLNQAYARDYQIKTKRPWLADFPQPVPFHYMHDAGYFGKTKNIMSWESHFTTMPPRSQLEKLSHDDHEHRVRRETRYGKDLSIALPKYRQGGDRELEIKMETISCAPRVFQIDDFLSKVEVEHIIDLIKDITLSRSAVHPGGLSDHQNDAKKANNEQTDTATRSSTNAWIEREASPIIDSIYRRASDLLGVDESLLRHRSIEEHPELATDHSIAELMQVVHYGEGEEYHAHHDFNYPAFGNRYQPARFASLLFYLNDVDEGGETVFPRAINAESHYGISVKPKAGTAILFYNVLPDGNFDDLSQHQSMPVRSGEKYLANLWIWDPIID